MNSNRSSNQGQGKANGKNRPKNSKRKAQGPPAGPQRAPKRQKQQSVAAAYATGQSGRGAKIQQSADSVRIVHREFIGNVVGSASFAISSSFAVNPGIAATFPWLSGMAQFWEAYRFRNLRFCYYTRTGSNIPGSVIMAHDPDSTDPAPATEQIMTTYQACEEDAPWKDIHLQLRQTALHELVPRKFIRTAALQANSDIKLYDSGNVFIGTVDGTAVAWGKLWVEYDVDLFTPAQPPGGVGSSGTLQGAGGSLAAATPFGAVPVATGGIVLSAPATNVVTMTGLTVGAEYNLQLQVAGTVITGLTSGSLTGMAVKSSLGTWVPAAGVNAGQAFTVLASAQTATFTWTVTATTVTASTLVVTQLVPIPAF